MRQTFGPVNSDSSRATNPHANCITQNSGACLFKGHKRTCDAIFSLDSQENHLEALKKKFDAINLTDMIKEEVNYVHGNTIEIKWTGVEQKGIIQNIWAAATSVKYIFGAATEAEGRDTGNDLIVKVYLDAFDTMGNMVNEKPFRELYGQCVLGGYPGFTCTSCFGLAHWPEKWVEGSNQWLPGQHPDFVMYTMATVPKGKKLDEIRLNEMEPSFLMGLGLEIIACWQRAGKIMGDSFAHFNLSPKNIFVNTTTEARIPIVWAKDITIKFPQVTIVDFELMTSDKFPYLTDDHRKIVNEGIRSLMTDDLTTFIMRWLPLEAAGSWIFLLQQVAKLVNTPDFAHLLTYQCIAVVYTLSPIWKESPAIIFSRFLTFLKKQMVAAPQNMNDLLNYGFQFVNSVHQMQVLGGYQNLLGTVGLDKPGLPVTPQLLLQDMNAPTLKKWFDVALTRLLTMVDIYYPLGLQLFERTFVNTSDVSKAVAQKSKYIDEIKNTIKDYLNDVYNQFSQEDYHKETGHYITLEDIKLKIKQKRQQDTKEWIKITYPKMLGMLLHFQISSDCHINIGHTKLKKYYVEIRDIGEVVTPNIIELMTIVYTVIRDLDNLKRSTVFTDIQLEKMPPKFDPKLVEQNYGEFGPDLQPNPRIKINTVKFSSTDDGVVVTININILETVGTWIPTILEKLNIGKQLLKKEQNGSVTITIAPSQASEVVSDGGCMSAALSFGTYLPATLSCLSNPYVQKYVIAGEKIPLEKIEQLYKKYKVLIEPVSVSISITDSMKGQSESDVTDSMRGQSESDVIQSIPLFDLTYNESGIPVITTPYKKKSPEQSVSLPSVQQGSQKTRVEQKGDAPLSVQQGSQKTRVVEQKGDAPLSVQQGSQKTRVEQKGDAPLSVQQGSQKTRVEQKADAPLVQQGIQRTRVKQKTDDFLWNRGGGLPPNY
jgi:hypothetical protein